MEPDCPMEEVFTKMLRDGQRKLLVASDGVLLGVISLADLTSYLAIREGLGIPAGDRPKKNRFGQEGRAPRG